MKKGEDVGGGGDKGGEGAVTCLIGVYLNVRTSYTAGRPAPPVARFKRLHVDVSAQTTSNLHTVSATSEGREEDERGDNPHTESYLPLTPHQQ